MNIWDYCHTRSGWRGIIDWIKFLPKAVKYAYQRAVRGYCDADLWDAGDTITEYLCRMLDAFCEKTDSWPDRDFVTFEEWIAYLKSISADLKYSMANTDDYNEHAVAYYLLEHDHYKDYTDEEKAIWERYVNTKSKIADDQMKKRADAFARLGMYTADIWW